MSFGPVWVGDRTRRDRARQRWRECERFCWLVARTRAQKCGRILCREPGIETDGPTEGRRDGEAGRQVPNSWAVLVYGTGEM